MGHDTASDLRKQSREADSGVSPYTTSPGRSRNMAAIRRSDTTPEIAVRSILHSRGHRYRKDHRLDLGSVKPRPDIVFTRRKVAVFIDGCFWHACPKHSKPPANNSDYWGPKLAANVERDRRYDEALSANGWKVIRAWEHESPTEVVARVEDALARRR
jgi:DNA mismatch endonuclease (patch repair protein)